MSSRVIEHIIVFIWLKTINLIIIDFGYMRFDHFWFQLSTLLLINLRHWTIEILFTFLNRIIQFGWIEIINFAISWHRSICADSFLFSDFFIHTQATA